MSTTIHNGFQFTSDNIYTINKNIQKFRFKVDECIKIKYCKITVRIAVHHLDLITCKLTGEKSSTSPYLHAINTIFDELKKANSPENKYFRHFLDYSASTTIHMYKNKFYGILFVDDNEINELWFKQRYIKDFSYWNNSDRPINVSDKKWNERSKIWNKILKDFHYIPALNGFTAELTKEMYQYVPLDINDVLKYIPDYEKRIENMIYAYVFPVLNSKNIKTMIEWKQENKKLYQKIYNKYNKILIKDITKEILISQPNEIKKGV